MSPWKELRLGDFASLSYGKALPVSQRAPGGTIPVYGSNGVVGHHDRPLVPGPGIIVGRKGSAGEVHYSAGPFWPIDTAFYIADGPTRDLRFAYYALVHLALHRLTGDSAVPGLNRDAAHGQRLTIPSPLQRHIASVLGSIDDLIENNRRRVGVLEKMTRAIFIEWFVHFRYPGHHDIALAVSPLGPIPEGWEAATLADVLELHYGKALKKEDRRGGGVAVVGSSGVVGWHDEVLVKGPTIVVGRKGNVGSVTWVHRDAWPIDTAYYVTSALPLSYILEQLRRTEFQNTHAAVPGLSRDQAYSRPFLLPPMPLMQEFGAVSATLALEARALDEASERLRRLRDLLLPKLVTGQIDLSHLDLDALAEVATA